MITDKQIKAILERYELELRDAPNGQGGYVVGYGVFVPELATKIAEEMYNTKMEGLFED